jgi:hypothetical protein
MTDNAFGDENICMKPFGSAEAISDVGKQHFNTAQMAIRKDCECGWGLIVKRFPVFAHRIPYLGKDKEGVEKSAMLMTAAFLLHNLCIRMQCDGDADMLRYDSFGRLVHLPNPPPPPQRGGAGAHNLAPGGKMSQARIVISAYINNP